MSVTRKGDLAGLLPVIISGGRPELAQRGTARLLNRLHSVTANPVWLVRDDRAPEYERDDHELVTYPRAEAEEYAAAHWIAAAPYRPGDFMGGFTEREWACRLAEERGCWGVLQLDDNLDDLYCFTGYNMTLRIADRRGGLGMFADLLAAVTLSTNSRITGAALDAVNPEARSLRYFARPGFPYSLFIERVGPGREEWYGPTEDDILHAWQYASSPTPATAAVLPWLHYKKEHKSRTGMRAHYQNHQRSVGLQRAAPEMAQLQVIATHANGYGQPRVFHRMKQRSISSRAPLIVTDRVLYGRAFRFAEELAAEVAAGFRADVKRRVAARAAKWDA